ncbi:hypothetical protein HAX54_033943, partial [Datura stramonium]|nr:hypothetical protein [Datura stramonium]
ACARHITDGMIQREDLESKDWFKSMRTSGELTVKIVAVYKWYGVDELIVENYKRDHCYSHTATAMRPNSVSRLS